MNVILLGILIDRRDVHHKNALWPYDSDIIIIIVIIIIIIIDH
jgi:hypothetical protein